MRLIKAQYTILKELPSQQIDLLPQNIIDLGHFIFEPAAPGNLIPQKSLRNQQNRFRG